jgi:hypothetical protein
MNQQHEVPAETVGHHFREIQDASKERTLELLSDGEIQLSSIKDYSHWEELLQTCRDTIAARKMFRFPGTRRACGDLMDVVMQHLRKEYYVRAPKCWLVIIRKLREEDGPVLIQPREPEAVKPSYEATKGNIQPDGILRHMRSAVSAMNLFHPGLTALEHILIEHARQHGIPQGWDAALPWIESLIASLTDVPSVLWEVRSDLAARVAELSGN